MSSLTMRSNHNPVKPTFVKGLAAGFSLFSTHSSGGINLSLYLLKMISLYAIRSKVYQRFQVKLPQDQLGILNSSYTRADPSE
jgi:hypothetical protein